MSRWWDQVKARGTVPMVAGLLGLAVAGRTMTPCPACGASTRGRTDKRAPVLIRDAGRWSCLVCDEEKGGAGGWGSALDLVAFRVTGARFDARSPAAAEVRARCADFGLCDPAEGSAGPAVPLRPLAPPEADLAAGPAPAPRDEVAELWARCPRVDERPVVAGYLRQRAIDASVVLDEDLARAAPPGKLPEWASHWSYFEAAFVLPLFDANGELAGLQARSITGPRKSLRMRRVAVAGLLLGTGAARAALAAGAWPTWYAGRPTTIEIVEGEPDFLTRATRDREAAVLGIPGSGAWSPDVARRVPPGSTIHVLTHQDEQGEKYSNLVAASLLGRCRIRRARWAA